MMLRAAFLLAWESSAGRSGLTLFGSHDRAPAVSKRGGARRVNRRLPGFRCDGRDALESPHPHKGRGIKGWPPSNGGEKALSKK